MKDPHIAVNQTVKYVVIRYYYASELHVVLSKNFSYFRVID